MNTPPELLNIQKLVYLLDEFHFQQFSSQLHHSKAALPHKLIQVIRQTLPAFDSVDGLCIKVYGHSGKNYKARLNQLTSYTFRLSSFLALNYPAYLYHNHSLVQRQVNEGKLPEAEFLAVTLLDLAKKVGDFESQVIVLKFLCFHSFLIKESLAGLKYSRQLTETVENQKSFLAIQSKIWEATNLMPVEKSRKEFKQLKAYCAQFQEHPCLPLRIISAFAHVYAVFKIEALDLLKKKELDIIKKLEKELELHSYVIFPFMTDLRGKLGYYTLNSPLMLPLSPELQDKFDGLREYYENSKFFVNYINPELSIATIQATRLLTLYHHQLNRSDYLNVITREDQRLTASLLKRCGELLVRHESKKIGDYDIISLKMLHAILQLFLGDAHVRKGVHELEWMLSAYQQINLGERTDGIFLCLISGYFALKDYDKCRDTFKRYSIIIKDKPMSTGNNIKIHTYYYISQWLSSKRTQYLEKIKSLLDSNYADDYPVSINALLKYWKIPVPVKE